MAEDRTYYVYALKDPRTSPAAPFYVGTGTRVHDHLVRADATPKGERIQEIQAGGHDGLVSRLVEDLSELQALRLERNSSRRSAPLPAAACSPTRFCPPAWAPGSARR